MLRCMTQLKIVTHKVEMEIEHQEIAPGKKWHQDMREKCCECSVTIEDLLRVYEDEPLKRLFMCINHGTEIICFLCFHNEKHKKLFKCQCSTLEHWISFPCGQPMLSHNINQFSQFHDKASDVGEDDPR